MPPNPDRPLPPQPKFKRSTTKSSKPDARGKVMVKIYLQYTKGSPGIPTPGNRKEEIVLEDATVGDVYAAVTETLFPPDVEE